MVGRRKVLAIKLLFLVGVSAASCLLSACQKQTTTSDNEVSDSADSDDIAALAVEEELEDSASLSTDMTETTQPNTKNTLLTILSRHRWTLVNVTDAAENAVVAFSDINSQVKLSFNQRQSQHTLSYSVGCNTISAPYQLQGHTLTTEAGMSTKISCGDLDTAENLLDTLMQGSNELRIEQGKRPILTQFTDDDVTLVWSGRLTSQARYNSKGETVFWAVDAKKVPCDAHESKQCLRIKPIVYDDQGIKTYKGKWKMFAGEIDGYQYDGSHEEILRLQRYQLDNSTIPDSGTTDENYTYVLEDYAYVLDAVIESTVAE